LKIITSERFGSGRFARVGAALGLAVLAGLGGCDRKPASPAAPPPQKVGVLTLTPRTIERTTELPGRVNAVLTADVRPQVNGIILKRLFTEGSEVQEGQPLYQIDPATYQAAYDSAQAALAHDQAALASARAKASRFKPLAAAQAVSTQEYDDAVAAAKETEADIATAKANIEQARINLDYTKVLAPISGRVGRSSVTPGALVTANQSAALATVTQLDPIYVDLNQSAATLLRLRQEMAKGEIELAGPGKARLKLKLEDGSDYALSGTLQFAEVTVDQGTGTVLLRAIFPNPDRILLPGMYVHAELQEGTDRNALLVPQQALSRNTRGDATVMLLGADNKAELRVVRTGPAIGQDWVITDGLKAGDKVIVDGLTSLRQGMVVQAVPASTETEKVSSAGSGDRPSGKAPTGAQKS
jgi:membrane fusion protein (multidrug efflux system)